MENFGKWLGQVATTGVGVFVGVALFSILDKISFHIYWRQ